MVINALWTYLRTSHTDEIRKGEKRNLRLTEVPTGNIIYDLVWQIDILVSLLNACFQSSHTSELGSPELELWHDMLSKTCREAISKVLHSILILHGFCHYYQGKLRLFCLKYLATC